MQAGKGVRNPAGAFSSKHGEKAADSLVWQSRKWHGKSFYGGKGRQ